MLILLRKIEEKLTFKVNMPKIKNNLKARKLYMLKKIKLKQKLYFVIMAYILMISTVVGISLYYLRQANKDFEHIYNNEMQNQVALTTINKNYINNKVQILLMLQHDPNSEISKAHDHSIDIHFKLLQDAVESNQKAMDLLQKNLTEPEELKLLDQLKDTRKAWQDKRNVLFNDLKKGNYSVELTKGFLSAMQKEGQAYEDSVTKLMDTVVARAKNFEKSTSEDYMFVQKLFGLFIVLIVLPLLGFMIVTIRYMNKSFTKINYHLNEIANGNLLTKIELDKEVNDEVNDILTKTEQMQINIANMIANIKESVESIANATSEMAKGNLDLSERTERQAANLQQMGSQSNDVYNMAKESMDEANKGNAQSNQASNMANESGKVIKELISNMQDINTSSKKIGDIISVIDGIAFQTNILALNAAVEAARAGEQGRGFAVVASEVRSLAQRSANAAKEIKTLIENSVKAVENGNQKVESAGLVIEETLKSILNVEGAMKNITVLSSNQFTSLEQVNQSILTVEDATQKNAALVEEASAAASELHDQTEKLRETIKKFKV